MISADGITKVCDGRWGCGELRWIEEFRVHTAGGGRATYCRDCEREFDRFRKGHDSHFDTRETPIGLLPELTRLAGASPAAPLDDLIAAEVASTERLGRPLRWPALRRAWILLEAGKEVDHALDAAA